VTMLQELILGLLLDSRDGLDLADVTRRCGFREDVVSRHLAELTERGYLTEDPDEPRRWRAVRYHDGSDIAVSAPSGTEA
jgi:DNA-binding transcriptional ArsR family regulator